MQIQIFLTLNFEFMTTTMFFQTLKASVSHPLISGAILGTLVARG